MNAAITSHVALPWEVSQSELRRGAWKKLKQNEDFLVRTKAASLPVLAQKIMLEGMRMERGKKKQKVSYFSDGKRVWLSLKCTYSRRLLLSVCLSVC